MYVYRNVKRNSDHFWLQTKMKIMISLHSMAYNR